MTSAALARRASPRPLTTLRKARLAIGDSIEEGSHGTHALALEHSRLSRQAPGPENRSNHRPAGSQDQSTSSTLYKENRTYDRVLGDLPRAMATRERWIFCSATPGHARTRRLLLGMLYDWPRSLRRRWTWSTQATQRVHRPQRTLPVQQAEAGSSTMKETNNEYPTGGFPAKGPDGQPTSEDPRFKEGGKPVPDVAASPGGHLWDAVRKAGLSYRNYGFFVSNGVIDKKRSSRRTISLPSSACNPAGGTWKASRPRFPPIRRPQLSRQRSAADALEAVQ